MPNAEEPLPFGPLLRHHRIAAGLTQEALAERTSLGVRSIQHLEGGAHLPHRETVDRLIRALGLRGHEGSHFERLAQPTPRPREAVSVPRREVADAAHPHTPGHNLPAPLSSFVGREAEVAAVTDLLRTGRLMTLVGVGGCGKTRLALAVAERLRETYPEGVWLVELASLTDPALLPKAMAVALGIQEQAQQPLRDTVAYFLRSRRLLLVLDNCEHLIDDCARLVADLLGNCSMLTVLATSREALGIPGEVAWRVPSLSVPERGHVSEDRRDPVASLLVAEAAQLFWQRARTTDPSFAVTAENAHAIAEICWRLDGIPLALELAAARIKVLSAAQIAVRLGDRFQLLTGGNRTALPRQQTLRATLEWSHDLLSAPERAVFRRLSAFAGGFSLDAAEAVGGASDIPTDAVLDLVSQLVDKSLVLVEKRGGEPRYRLLETVRPYSHERLVEAGEAEEARDRHRDWYVALAERAEVELYGPRQLDWLERLELEHDNLRAGLTWSQDRAPEIALQLVGSLYRFWRTRSYFREGRAWLDAALTRAAEGSPARAKALVGAGILAYEQGDYQTARSQLEESVAWCRKVGAKERLSSALLDLGLCLWMVGEDVERLQAVWDESLALFQEVGDERNVGWALSFLGGLAASTDEFGRARDFSDQAVQRFRRIGDAWSLSQAPGNLGGVLLMQGDVQRARAVTEEQLEIAQRLESRYGVGAALYGLARVAQSDGDPERAERLLAESLRLLEQIGSRGAYDVLRDLGALAVQRGEPARGVRLLAVGGTGGFPNPGLWLWLRHRKTLQAEWEASLAMARSVLGEESLAQTWAEGQAMTLEEAVSDALSDDDVADEDEQERDGRPTH